MDVLSVTYTVWLCLKNLDLNRKGDEDDVEMGKAHLARIVHLVAVVVASTGCLPTYTTSWVLTRYISTSCASYPACEMSFPALK